MKKLYIGTNTKMNKTISETSEFLKELKHLTCDIDDEMVELFVIPSFTALAESRKILDGSNVSLGAQNMCWEESGQFTGEISPRMLKEVGVEIVEIGHSERRHIFGETDDEIEKKVKTTINFGFIPLLCIGETLEQKEYNITDEILSVQIKRGLRSIQLEDAKKIWIAYEPVWAIGADGTAIDKSYANERHTHIRNVLIDLFGEETGNNIPVLYGGSVNYKNATELISVINIDGLFIGRSAWSANDFNKILRAVLEANNKKPER